MLIMMYISTRVEYKSSLLCLMGELPLSSLEREPWTLAFLTLLLTIALSALVIRGLKCTITWKGCKWVQNEPR